MMMTETDIRATLREFISENFLYMRPSFQLGDDDPLLERGVVDSMGVMEVLQYLEDHFGVKPNDDEITEENLNSVNAITRYVARKYSASRAA